MLQAEPSNIFTPRNDWNVIALRCKQNVTSYAILVTKTAKLIEKETGFNPMWRTGLRTRELTEARQIFMSLLVSRNNKTLAYIGKLVGKNHATVIHSVQTVCNLIETDKSFKELYGRIEEKFKKL